MKSGRELKLGIFVIAVIVVSFFVINFLRGKDIFNREMELVSRYGNVEGLVPSDPVYIKGYKAGSVVSVDYNTETDSFDVVCSVLKKFRIPENSLMTIYSRDIMGGKAVRIDLGTSAGLVSDGGFLSPSSQPDMMASVSESIVPLMSKLNATLADIDAAAVSVNELLGKENRESIGRTIASIEKIMSDARKISSAIGDKSEELSLFIDNMAAVGVKLDSISVKADASMDDIAAVTASLSEADIEGLVVSFKSLLGSVQDPDGTIGKLLTDGKAYDSFEELISDMDSLVRKIQENPKKFIRISLF